MKYMWSFFYLFCFSLISSNLIFFFSKENESLFATNNDLLYKLTGKNIISPKMGEYKKRLYNGSSSSNAFWTVVGVNEKREEDFPIFSSNYIDSIPTFAQKACYRNALCAFWLEGEKFENLYLIDTPRETPPFKTTTALISPQLMKNLKGVN